MRILFAGDVVGKSGRGAVNKYLGKIRKHFKTDFIILNGENAAHGFGLTPKMYQAFLNLGVDVVTMGNHTFDKADIVPALEKEPFLIRPMNYPENTVGRGFCIKKAKNGTRVCVAQVLGSVYMKNTLNPFESMADFLDKHPIGRDYDILIVDIHAEASSEKMCFAHTLDGRASLVVGTHTHVPTGDMRILPAGTGYMTDIGMCGDYDSSIGMEFAGALSRFESGKKERLVPAEKEGSFSGVIADIDEATGKCQNIFAVRCGPHLENTIDL